MDYSGLENLKLKQEKGIQDCDQKIQQWEKFGKDYEDLRERLLTLPDKVSYDIMVPICGNVAFVPGKMIHTNEIMVLLGEDYLVERSAKQAAEITERRSKYCNDMIKSLQEEKSQVENWMKYTSEIQLDAGMEIKEDYNEEEEKLWKERHKANVKRHKQNDTSDPTQSKSMKSSSDFDLWARLEELEKQENKQAIDEENSTHDLIEEDYSDDVSEDASETSSVASDSSAEQNEITKKKISWEDKSYTKNETINIFFKHSTASADSNRTQCSEIVNPSQIYKKFREESKTSPPKLKSILKTPTKYNSKSSISIINSDVSENDNPRLCHQGNYNCQENVNQKIKVDSSNLAFTGEIKEKEASQSEMEGTNSILSPTKPVSRFKARRMQK